MDSAESIPPEFESLELFVEFMIDEERSVFTHDELRLLMFSLKRSAQPVRKELESYGLKLAVRPVERAVRGFLTNSNDRWYGPGSSPMHGGSGWEQISGFAGQKG